MLFTSQRIVVSLLLLVLAPVMVACGSRAPRLEPPRIKLVSLAVQDRSSFDLDLRLSNPAARQMKVNEVRLELRIDGQALPALRPDFSGQLPALGEELLSVSGPLPGPVAERLAALTEGRRNQLPLAITGQVRHSDGQSFDIDQTGWLSATPGRPWQFR